MEVGPHVYAVALVYYDERRSQADVRRPFMPLARWSWKPTPMPDSPVGSALEHQETQPPFALWQQARAEHPNDEVAANKRWFFLMTANGHNRQAIEQTVIGHRILNQHNAGEFCATCPCPHCGTTKDDPDGDHTCPCPYSDTDCPWHWVPAAAVSREDLNV